VVLGDARGEQLHGIVVPEIERARAEGVDLATVLRDDIAALGAGLAPHLRLLSWELRADPLPRTSTLKLRRHALAGRSERATSQERPWTDADREWARAEPTARALEAIRGFLGQADTPHPDDMVDLDLRVDSIQRLELGFVLEQRFEARLEERALRACGTVRELVALATGAARGGRQGASWDEVLLPATREAAPPPVAPEVRLAAIPARWLARAWWSLEVEGLEHLPPGPCVLCPNHNSALDGILLALALPADRASSLVHLGKARHLRSGLRRVFAPRAGVVAIDTDGEVIDALRTCARSLGHGRSLVLFPEGTRSPDGRLQLLRPGAAILGAHLGVPLVPVAISGTREIFASGTRYPRRARVTIRIGRPLSLATPEDRSGVREEGVAKLTSQLTSALQDLITSGQDLR
jgi:1-acyl-sn-glycerol-3-phosphate acyltransferase